MSVWAVNIALMFAALPAVLFCIFYAVQWNKLVSTPAGRHLLGFTFIIALILVEELLRRVFREYISIETHRVFLAITISIAALFLWQRFYALMKYQILPRRRAEKLREKRHEEFLDGEHG